jgi:hypothetical protein
MAAKPIARSRLLFEQTRPRRRFEGVETGLTLESHRSAKRYDIGHTRGERLPANVMLPTAW